VLILMLKKKMLLNWHG